VTALRGRDIRIVRPIEPWQVIGAGLDGAVEMNGTEIDMRQFARSAGANITVGAGNVV
jgi:hypothetical protein